MSARITFLGVVNHQIDENRSKQWLLTWMRAHLVCTVRVYLKQTVSEEKERRHPVPVSTTPIAM